MSSHENDRHKVHAIAVSAFRGWSTHPAVRVDAKLVSFRKPKWVVISRGEEAGEGGHQSRPSGHAAQCRLNGLEEPFNAPVQRIVIDGLPVGSVRNLFDIGFVDPVTAVAAQSVLTRIFQKMVLFQKIVC